LQGAQLASSEAIFQDWPALEEKKFGQKRGKEMNATVVLIGGGLIFVVAVAVLVVAVVMIARRHAAPAPAPAPEPEPAPAAAGREIGEAVGEVHDSLDGLIVRTIDGIGSALAAAVPAKVFVGAAPAAPDAAPAAAQKDFATRSAKAEYDRVLALFK